MALQVKAHGSVEIVSDVPADTPAHLTPYSWQPYNLQPEKITVRVWVGGWSVDVDGKRVKKDGTASQVDMQVSYFQGANDIPEYVHRFVEHAQRVQAFAFPATTSEEN